MLLKASSDIIDCLVWKLLLAWLLGDTTLDLDIITESRLNLLLECTITFFEQQTRFLSFWIWTKSGCSIKLLLHLSCDFFVVLNLLSQSFTFLE